MRNLIALELKRNRLRSYHIAVLICGVTMIGFQYLMAAIPYMDPTEPDAELFSQYPFLMGIRCFWTYSGPLGNGGLLFPHRYSGVLHLPGLSKGGSHYECPGDHQ